MKNSSQRLHLRRGAEKKTRLARLEPLEPRTLFSTYTVNLTGDPNIVVLGTLSLRLAVADANANPGADTINFSPAVFPAGSLTTITLAFGQLVLSDTSGATTIAGPGADVVAVSGNHLSRIFQVNSGVTANISGLTLDNGDAALGLDGRYDGGAIYNLGSLRLADSTVTGNTAGSAAGTTYASARGAGIASTGPLIVQNSTFSSNVATGTGYNGSGQGFSGEGGAIYGYSAGPVTISGSTLTNNSAIGGIAPVAGGAGGVAFGGAVYSSTTLNISNSTLSGNVAAGTSGAFTGMGNVGGSGNGGAIFSANSAILVSTTITGNKATGGDAGDYGYNGGAHGGGIYTTGALTITSSVISKNAATAGDVTGDSIPPFLTTGANGAGGGIYSVLNNSTGIGALTLALSTVSGNTALGGNSYGDYTVGTQGLGGGIFAKHATISQSTISSNSATGGVGDPSSQAPPFHAGKGGLGQGGGLLVTDSSIITDSTIAHNMAVGGAGGSSSTGAPPNESSAGTGGNASGGGISTYGTLRLRDTTISGNATFAGAGGAGYRADPGGHGVAPGKSGTASGGGIIIAASTTRLDNTIVSANKAGVAFNDILGSVGSVVAASSHNLIGLGGGLINNVNGNHTGVTNPKLSSLGFHGGPTQTMTPLAGSLAINHGSNAVIPPGVTTDQRLLPRIAGGTVDIGAVEVGASISGEVFNDADGDGKRNVNEPALANWTVYLDLNTDGSLDAGDLSTKTDSAGDFSFKALAPGVYVVRVDPMAGYKPTKPVGGVITLTLSLDQASPGHLFGEKKI